MREPRLLARTEIVQEEPLRAVAIRDVDEPAAVRRPPDLTFARGRRRDARGRAAVARRGGEHLAVNDERHLLAVRRKLHLLEAVRERHVLDGRTGRRPAERDRDWLRLARAGVEGPDGEVALERDHPAVSRDRRPQDSAVRESGDGRWLTTDRTLHNVLWSRLVGDVIERAAIGRPHGPLVLRLSRAHALVAHGRWIAQDPDLRFIEVTPTDPPPLSRGRPARREGDGAAVRRRRRPVLVRVPVGAHRHGRPTLGADAEHVVHAGDLAARGREVEPLAVGRPRVELVEPVVERQAGEVAGRERQHVHVAAAGARRDERQSLPVGRVQRPRFVRGMRDEQPSDAAGRRHRPNVAAGRERDLAMVGRDPGLGECGHTGRRAVLRGNVGYKGSEGAEGKPDADQPTGHMRLRSREVDRARVGTAREDVHSAR